MYPDVIILLVPCVHQLEHIPAQQNILTIQDQLHIVLAAEVEGRVHDAVGGVTSAQVAHILHSLIREALRLQVGHAVLQSAVSGCVVHEHDVIVLVVLLQHRLEVLAVAVVLAVVEAVHSDAEAHLLSDVADILRDAIFLAIGLQLQLGNGVICW